MAEYDLVCDACREPLSAEDGLISWTTAGGAERGFALTHAGHVPAEATVRVEARSVVSPTGYVRFVSDRLGRRIDDAEPLRAILWALAPFVMRPDNATEMDSMRAASFGARVGVKPGTQAASTASPEKQQEGGK